MKKASLAFKINGVIAALFFFGMILAVVSITVFKVTQYESAEVSESSMLANDSAKLLNGYLKMRFDARNYMLGGGENFYESFMATHEAMGATVEHIESSIGDDPDHVQGLANIKLTEQRVNDYVQSLRTGRIDRNALTGAVNELLKVFSKDELVSNIF